MEFKFLFKTFNKVKISNYPKFRHNPCSTIFSNFYTYQKNYENFLVIKNCEIFNQFNLHINEPLEKILNKNEFDLLFKIFKKIRVSMLSRILVPTNNSTFNTTITQLKLHVNNSTKEFKLLKFNISG